MPSPTSRPADSARSLPSDFRTVGSGVRLTRHPRPDALLPGGQTMSNLDRRPSAQELGGLESTSAGPALDLLPGKEVLLGKSTRVRRLLPTLGRRLVGAWAFVDHYGPDDVAAGPGMQVPPHPHTGLQTVAWLLEGSGHHRDSLGSDVTFGPRELPLMTAGLGIAHSEQSPVTHPRLLHGVQLWVVLPDAVRDMPPTFEHHAA